jgi:hypothetical protein
VLRYEQLMKVRCGRKLLLTGTPLQNNLVSFIVINAYARRVKMFLFCRQPCHKSSFFYSKGGVWVCLVLFFLNNLAKPSFYRVTTRPLICIDLLIHSLKFKFSSILLYVRYCFFDVGKLLGPEAR